MVSRKKVQSEIKKAFRLPSNAVVMSMMAVILVCAAPALVSIIDDSYSASIETPVNGLVPLDEKYTVYVDSPADPIDKTVSVVSDDGAYIVALDKPSIASTVRYYSFDWFSKSALADVTKIVLTIDSDKVSSIRFSFGGTWKEFVNVADANGDPTTTWVFEPSSIDRARMQSDVGFIGIRILFPVGDAPAALTMEYDTYGTTSIPYGEIIIGATGALLLVCAILATPWVSTSGLTVKRRR